MREVIHGSCMSRGWWKVVLSGKWCHTLTVGDAFRVWAFADSSYRIDVESMCSMAWEHITSSPNEWIHHSCTVKGYKEGYVTIDGLAKVTRTICAAPKEKLKLLPGFPNIIQCCHNSGC